MSTRLKRTRSLWPLLAFCALLGCKVQWESPQNSEACKPTFEGEVFGCLRVSEGQQELHISPARLEQRGRLWGFHGGQWDASVEFRLPRGRYEALRFQFFGIKASASFADWPSFCGEIQKKGVASCLSSEGDCSFVLEFRPPVPSEAYQFGPWSRPTEAWVHTRLSEPTTCQLFEPRRSEQSEPRPEPPRPREEPASEPTAEPPPPEKPPEPPEPPPPPPLCTGTCQSWFKATTALDNVGDTGFRLLAFGASQKGDALFGISDPGLGGTARVYAWLKTRGSPLYARARFTPPEGSLFSLKDPRRIMVVPQGDLPYQRRYAVVQFANKDSFLFLGMLLPLTSGGASNLSFANCGLPFAPGVTVVDIKPIPKQSRLFVGASSGHIGLVDIFVPAATTSHKLTQSSCALTKPQPPLLSDYIPEPKHSLKAVAASSDGQRLFYFFAAYERESGGMVIQLFDLDQSTAQELHTSNEKLTVMVASSEPRTSRVLYGAQSGKVVLVGVQSQKACILSHSPSNPVQALDLNAKGEQILVLFQDGAIELWALQSGSTGQQCGDYQKLFSAPGGGPKGIDARLSGECSLITALFSGGPQPPLTQWYCSK